MSIYRRFFNLCSRINLAFILLQAFFLEDVSAYASRGGCFLSKSWLAFTLFNLFLYLCVVVQFIVVYSGAIGTNQNGKFSLLNCWGSAETFLLQDTGLEVPSNHFLLLFSSYCMSSS